MGKVPSICLFKEELATDGLIFYLHNDNDRLPLVAGDPDPPGEVAWVIYRSDQNIQLAPLLKRYLSLRVPGELIVQINFIGLSSLNHSLTR